MTLAVVSVLFLPAFLVKLGERGPLHFMEGIALLTAQETWQNQQAGEASAWLSPTINGSFRLNKPPMLVWLDLIAFVGMEVDSSSPEDVILRARIVSVGLGFVLAISVFWLGCGLRGPRLGLFAAIVALGTPFLLQTQARMASYDIHLAAWSALACAAAVWALRPFGPARSRRVQWLSWIVAGIALALSSLSKNPNSLVVFSTCIASVMMLDRVRIGSRLAGVIGALIVMLIFVLPWYGWHYARDPEAVLAIWENEFSGRDSPQHAPWFYIILLRLVFPWTVMFLAGLAHPFFAKDEERARRLLPWVWFLALLVIYSIHPGKAPRYIFPVLPALAILIAQVINDHARLFDENRAERSVRALLGAHWLMILVAGAAMPFLFDRLNIAPLPAEAAISVAALLSICALLGAWQHLKLRHTRAIFLMSLWLAIFTTVYWRQHALGEDPSAPIRAEAARIASIIGDAPLRTLSVEADEGRPKNEFLFYLRRSVPNTRLEQFDADDSNIESDDFMIDTAKPLRRALREAGYEAMTAFEDEPGRVRELWTRPQK